MGHYINFDGTNILAAVDRCWRRKLWWATIIEKETRGFNRDSDALLSGVPADFRVTADPTGINLFELSEWETRLTPPHIYEPPETIDPLKQRYQTAKKIR
jgi:hypothetical protein